MLVLLMVVAFQLCHPLNAPLTTTTVKGGIILQGAVDNKGRFIDIYVGWLGRVHDAHVFANSTLSRQGEAKALLPDWMERVDRIDVPLVMLGDPLPLWLIS